VNDIFYIPTHTHIHTHTHTHTHYRLFSAAVCSVPVLPVALVQHTAIQRIYAIVARRKITLTICTAPCVYLVVILCFQFFFSPFCSYTHDLPRGIIPLCIHIITLYARDCLRVSVIYYYIVYVFRQSATQPMFAEE